MALDILALKIVALWASHVANELQGEAAANRWANPQDGRWVFICIRTGHGIGPRGMLV